MQMVEKAIDLPVALLLCLLCAMGCRVGSLGNVGEGEPIVVRLKVGDLSKAEYIVTVSNRTDTVIRLDRRGLSETFHDSSGKEIYQYSPSRLLCDFEEDDTLTLEPNGVESFECYMAYMTSEKLVADTYSISARYDTSFFKYPKDVGVWQGKVASENVINMTLSPPLKRPSPVALPNSSNDNTKLEKQGK